MSDGVSHPDMHFILVQSNGGPFEDNAFAAGWNLATLDARLTTARVHGLFMGGVLLHGALFPQIDLIAMRHGFVVDAEPYDQDDDYSWFYFERAVGGEVS